MAPPHTNFCLVKPRERALRDKTKRILQGPIPYALEPIIVSSRKVPPHKEAKKALRYKTKSCCNRCMNTRPTCLHNYTKF